MSKLSRQLHLNAFLMGIGHHEAAWRAPESSLTATWELKHYVELAKIAERGTFDSIFFADGPSLQGDLRYRPVAWLDPLIILPAVAAATQHIGLVATASTIYKEPYNLARRFASLDHVSDGRAGWNIVTTAGVEAAQNVGLDDVPLHKTRYSRASEFGDVCVKLWNSWEDDFLLGDKTSGWFADGERVHHIEHAGEHFRVRGPLNVPPSPQRHPLLVQAGSSEDGRAFAARYAEAVFTAQQTLADGQAFYSDLKRRTAASGRNPEHIKILPGLDGSSRDLAIEVQNVKHPSRLHLDIESDDVEAEVRRLEQLGARAIERVRTWVVLEAPTGQRFCVIRAKRSLDGAPGAQVWP